MWVTFQTLRIHEDFTELLEALLKCLYIYMYMYNDIVIYTYVYIYIYIYMHALCIGRYLHISRWHS